VSAYATLVDQVREANLVGSVASVLGWDQETMMPQGGVEFRSRQLALLARMHHERSTDPRIGELIDHAASDGSMHPEGPEAANVREMRRDFDRARKLPASLVEELAKVSSVAQHEWAAARAASDFSKFRPWLEKLVALNRDKAQCLGIPEGGEAWDALADTYEPGCRAADVAALFGPLRDRLKGLLDRVMGSSRGPSNRFNELDLDIGAQERFVRFVAESLGFDFTRGRLDRSTHPFCGGSHCNDVRLTTRYRLDCVNDALGSTIHESGHGMYEQGLPFDHVGTPLGEAVSLGIHESQSRLWENQVGRSRAFWTWCAPHVARHFGDRASGFSADELYGAANVVEPGFIRVDADEATYNQHVMVRFALERALIGGSLDVADLPAEWNRLYSEFLGLTVPDDRRGCLQDVHWSMGAFGYFPTYTLGTLYAAQLFDAARTALPGLEDAISRGEFAPLLGWLNREVHAHGRRYLPGILCRRVTGKALSAEPFLAHLEAKLVPLYGL
jgi:carboxypeptidase Taq